MTQFINSLNSIYNYYYQTPTDPVIDNTKTIPSEEDNTKTIPSEEKKENNYKSLALKIGYFILKLAIFVAIIHFAPYAVIPLILWEVWDINSKTKSIEEKMDKVQEIKNIRTSN